MHVRVQAHVHVHAHAHAHAYLPDVRVSGDTRHCLFTAVHPLTSVSPLALWYRPCCFYCFDAPHAPCGCCNECCDQCNVSMRSTRSAKHARATSTAPCQSAPPFFPKHLTWIAKFLPAFFRSPRPAAYSIGVLQSSTHNARTRARTRTHRRHAVCGGAGPTNLCTLPTPYMYLIVLLRLATGRAFFQQMCLMSTSDTMEGIGRCKACTPLHMHRAHEGGRLEGSQRGGLVGLGRAGEGWGGLQGRAGGKGLCVLRAGDW